MTDTATAEKPIKKVKQKAPAKEGGAKRSKFASLYPEDAKLTLKVTENPKKAGSKSRERFELYSKAETVGDFLAAGGTYQDVAYDIGRGFIAVGK